jgi:DNA-binding response OmpR family regulator
MGMMGGNVMQILIAEDDRVSRRVLEATLAKWGYDVIVTQSGVEAWAALQKPGHPHLAVLDWMMPELEGPEVCRRVRGLPDGAQFYLLLLTAKVQVEDIVQGLDAGADDYVTKPFEPDELRARITTGRRIVELHGKLAARVTELERALAEVKRLSGLLPICAYCKRIRSTGDTDYWQCYERHVRPELERL